MKNKSVSDFVAASMDAVLKSQDHKSLFGTQYKYASDESDAKDGKKCPDCGKPMSECKCDSANADDNDARSGKKDMGPFSTRTDDPYYDQDTSHDPRSSLTNMTPTGDLHDTHHGMHDKQDPSLRHHSKDPAAYQDKKHPSMKAHDSYDKRDRYGDTSDADDSDADDNSAEDAEMQSEAAFTMAIDSLLTASAALDSVGMEKSSAFSLKLASIVVEAKKKKDDSKKVSLKDAAKVKADKEKEKAAKEKQMAKDKAAKEKEKAARDTQMAKDKTMKEKEKAAAKARMEKEKKDKEREKNLEKARAAKK